jgi:arsenate reductase
LAVAEDLGVDVDVVKYINDPPDADLLRRIVDGLEDPVEDLVRKDSQFKKLELDPDDYVGNPDAVVALLAERKQLLQRPVIVKGDLAGDGPLEAIIGRPKDRIAPFITS